MIQMKPLHQKKIKCRFFLRQGKANHGCVFYFLRFKILKTFFAALSCYRSIDFCLLGCWLAAFVKSLHLQVYLNNK